MLEYVITGLMLVVAIIHMLPISGFFGLARLNRLYGINISDANLEILMRHRAILFGLLGGFIGYAAFEPSVQAIAFVVAFISLVSFIVLSFTIREFNSSIRSVVIADFIALGSLLAAIGLYMIKIEG